MAAPSKSRVDLEKWKLEAEKGLRAPLAPIKYWSHSSLMAFLRNPLAWYKLYDMPRNPASIIGSSAHLALQHFYSGIGKEGAIELGLEYMRKIPDFEMN